MTKGVLLALGIWLLFAMIFPGRPSAKGRAIVAAMKNQVSQIQDRELTRPELETEIANITLDWDLNSFTPEITFESPTRWSVTLVPEKRKTYLNPQHMALRILLLEFNRMDYPDITFNSNERKHNKASEVTVANAPEPQG